LAILYIPYDLPVTLKCYNITLSIPIKCFTFCHD
jgi:hypothetical protein